MSEYRSFENDNVKDMVLKYADPKYKFAIMQKQDESRCPDTIWTLHETKDEALNAVEKETAAYGNDPEYQFYACEIKRNVTILKSIINNKPVVKEHHTAHLERVN